jgi:hypothetical protein
MGPIMMFRRPRPAGKQAQAWHALPHITGNL